jgi:riboflavin biosynthesis pyrimidine reductase
LRVIIVAAMTICGRISPAGIGSHEDRQLLEQLRDETDASLIGASTLREADPEMRGGGGRLAERRLRAVISGSGNVPVEGKNLFSFAPRPILFTSDAASEHLAARLGGRGDVFCIPSGPHGLSVAAAISRLGALGAGSVLIEGGGLLNYASLAEGVVDELRITIVPRISGHRDAASLVSGSKSLGQPFLGLQLHSCRTAKTGELFCHYTINKG